MGLNDTITARFKKLLRIELRVSPQDLAKLTPKSQLGEAPLGFDDVLIDSDLRHRINDWFDDFADPQPPGTWDPTTTVGDVTNDLVDASEIDGLAAYRAHVEERSNVALDRAVGMHAPNVPTPDRPKVQAALNASLQTLLIRDVSLDDLAGPREDIVDNLVGRMVV